MSMFWGLSIKPNRKYTQTIVKSFHISGAALEQGDNAKLFITADKSKFALGTLSSRNEQIPLDLNFCKGDKIMFQTTGDAQISLTGYLHNADESDDEYEKGDIIERNKTLAGRDLGEEDDSEEEDEEDEDEDDSYDSKLVAEYSSFLEGESEEAEEEEDEEDESDDEEEEEEEEEDDKPKVKKQKLSDVAKTPAKEQNGVAKKAEKQQKSKDKKSAVHAEVKKDQTKAKENKQAAAERTIAGGVKIQDLHSGNGPEAKQGKRVTVYYIGRLKSNNKVFDSIAKGNGFKFTLGAAEVIKGWEVGIPGMKVGGKRRITCPAHMAYGARGHLPTIPPNAVLVFDVELKAVH